MLSVKMNSLNSYSVVLFNENFIGLKDSSWIIPYLFILLLLPLFRQKFSNTMVISTSLYKYKQVVEVCVELKKAFLK